MVGTSDAGAVLLATKEALADLAIYQGFQMVAGAGFEPATFGL